MDTIYKQLAQIQQKLNAPKSRRNKFGNYNYRNCEDILDAVKPLLGDLVIILNDEVVVVGDRYYIKATAILGKDDGTKFQVSAYAREALDKKGMDDSQITGAASSYARKYALNGLFAIDDTKDADSEEVKEEKKPTTSIKTQTKDNTMIAFSSWDTKVDKTPVADLEKLKEEIKEAKDLKPAEKFILNKKVDDKLSIQETTAAVVAEEPLGENEVNVEDIPF